MTTHTAAMVLCLASLLAGCAQRTPPSNALAPAPFTEVDLKHAALQYLFDKFTPASAAYVLRDKRDGDALVRRFPGHVPPVSNTVDVDTSSGLALDRATGKRVDLWSATVDEITGDHAVVHVSVYSGSLSAAGYTLHLRRTANGWQVVAERLNYVA